MKPTQWMRIAAVASAMGLAGTAIANDMDSSSNAASNESAASVIDQATPSTDQGSSTSSPSADQGSAMTAPSTGQNANARSDQNGKALALPSDLDMNVPATGTPSGNASSPMSSDLGGNAAASPSDLDRNVPATGTASGNASSPTSSDLGGNASASRDTGTNANDLTTPSPNDNVNAPGATVGGETQGSTMQSPKTTGVPGSASGTAGAPHERLSTTNSDNFNAWASDYAAQHNGRIGRQEFLDEMAQRFDQLDAQHQGSLTPYEVEEILIVTPQTQGATQSSSAQETSNGAQGTSNMSRPQ